jgi:Tfp pilus assembly protein PilE
MGKKNRKVKSITLVEIMVSLAIIVLVMSILLAAFVACTFLNESNSNLVIALNDAQYIMEEIAALPYDEVSSYVPQQFTNLNNEVISVTINDISSRVKQVNTRVSWTERSQRQRETTLSTYVGG